METALRWRIEKAQKEIQRLQQEKGNTRNQYALGLIDGQIMAHQMELGTLEDLLIINEQLEIRKRLREVI